MLDEMFRGSRAPRSRSEDRCDGAGSEADGAKPPVKPGPRMPVLGVLVFQSRSALVKLPSSGLRIEQARRPPGRFRPARRIAFSQSSVSPVRVRSIAPASHTGRTLPRNSRSIAWRAASVGRGGLARRVGDATSPRAS